jgi:hypothetical protein
LQPHTSEEQRLPSPLQELISASFSPSSISLSYSSE